VVTVTGDREPGRFYLYEASSGELKLLNKRKPWLDNKQLATMRPITLEARDGLELHGYVATPPGSDGKNLPLVVVPHGGPYWVHDDWSFDEDTQVLATRGYAVLRVNFRGSGGFGRAYIDAGMREWGGKMQDDVTDATRWAIEQGIADPTRVCIYGASYGGYAALMGAVKDPDLYRCAIGVAGVYDLELAKKWGDIQRSRFGERYLERALGSDRAEIARRSPARRAKEIKAAVMLVHGGRDFRVSPEHAKAMRKALDEAGVPYEGYFPSYEAHGIADDKNRLEYYTRILAFLDRHIGGARPGPAP
jgi:dipeptidyl aminopeptidase/acylaminoacyl peptidase